MCVRSVADARRARAPSGRCGTRRGDLPRARRPARNADRSGAAHGLRDGRLPRLRDRDRRRQRACLSRGPGLRSRRRRIRGGRARHGWSRLMPWRRFRKKVERPIDVSKSIEESLEDAAAGESEEDAVELAELDDASTNETASGEADDSRAPTDLGERLRDALATEEQRGGLPSERPLARGASRSHEGPSEGDPRAATSGARYPEVGVDLAVDAARGLRLKNPVMTASGTFGQGVEYAELFDVSRLGAIVNKGTTPAARPGNPQYRIAETPSGILNSIGLENPGAAEVARKYGKAWAELGVAVIVNVAGDSVDDYVYVVHEMTGTPGVVGYEINVSCPNVKGGMLFGCDPDLAAEVTRAVKAETELPVIVKLTPNAPDVVAVARACEEAGADALT